MSEKYDENIPVAKVIAPGDTLGPGSLSGLTHLFNTTSPVPLKLSQPMNMIVFLSFYSPMIIVSIITSLSIVFQNFKGLIYLGFMLVACTVRHFVYMSANATPNVYNKSDICTVVEFSKYGNASFSSFVFAFTIMYVSFPMFMNNDPNFWIFTSMLAYFFIDIFIKVFKKCVNYTELILNVLSGMTLSVLIVTLMYSGGSGKYLFFNEVSTNKDICYQPSNQTFKCKVYKDGTLVNEI
jgi:hypothetical protein